MRVGRNGQDKGFLISDHQITQSYITLIIEDTLSRHHMQLKFQKTAKCVVVSHIKTISAHMCFPVSYDWPQVRILAY